MPCCLWGEKEWCCEVDLSGGQFSNNESFGLSHSEYQEFKLLSAFQNFGVKRYISKAYYIALVARSWSVTAICFQNLRYFETWALYRWPFNKLT